MNTKAKGTKGERDLVHMFWDAGYAAIRVAGSGSMKYPCPDILAGNNVRKIAIECKVANDKRKYFTKKEIDDLRLFCSLFGAEAWIGVKLEKEDWHFIMLEDLKETELGFSLDKDIVRNKGLLFEELIN